MYIYIMCAIYICIYIYIYLYIYVYIYIFMYIYIYREREREIERERERDTHTHTATRTDGRTDERALENMCNICVLLGPGWGPDGRLGRTDGSGPQPGPSKTRNIPHIFERSFYGRSALYLIHFSNRIR